MKKILILLIVISFMYGYDTKKIHTDKFTATLISSTVSNKQKAILYIHGFNDYVFNEEMIDTFNNANFNFFGIDLHNYGRSITKDTKYPFYFENVDEFFDEILMAINIIKTKHNIQDITIIAHSQGGLITSLFLDKYKNAVNRVVLNSPFFDFYKHSLLEKFALPFLVFAGDSFPYIKISNISINKYSASIHKDYFGEFDFDTSIKKVTSTYVYLGWVRSIYKAHQRLQQGLDIKIPVLILHSSSSILEDEISLKEDLEDFQNNDVVLDVEDIKKYGKNIGSNVQLHSVKNAIHDVFLSKKSVRKKALSSTIDWINKN